MGEIARRNDAMSADFKAIGKTLSASTKAINTNTSNLYWLLKDGIKIHTNDITKSVVEEFERLSGQSYQSLVSNTIINALKKDINDAKQANVNTQLLAETVVNATNINNRLIKQLKKKINIYLIEFSGILLLTLATPGWWKLLTTIATTAIAYIFNIYLEDKNNDN
jgi:hypothetical protein